MSLKNIDKKNTSRTQALLNNFFCKERVVFRRYMISALLIAMSVVLTTSARSQLVNLNAKNASLATVLNKIESQAGLHFWYEDNLLVNTKTVSVDIVNASVKKALDRCFEGQPVTYSIVDKTVVVKPRININNTKTQKNSPAEKANIDIKGRVLDEEGAPIGQITVSLKTNAGKGTSTDANGNFELKDVPENGVLVFSGVGYEEREVKVNARSFIEVRLTIKIVTIDEVVITGYQNIDRKLFTGSSTKLLAKDAERAGVPDISRMLEGQVAGVSVQNVSGTFGAAPKIRVRGATSISGDNKPLWVVDGIILEDVVNISNEQLSTGDANTLIGSSVAGLNPDDIESFTILKDAAATAMYGARAMNGVIVVTTKKGKATDGKPLLSYTSNWTSYLKPTYDDYNIMNSADQVGLYLELEEKGYLN